MANPAPSTQNQPKDKPKMDAQTEKTQVKPGNGAVPVTTPSAVTPAADVKSASNAEHGKAAPQYAGGHTEETPKRKYTADEKKAAMAAAVEAEKPVLELEAQLEKAKIAASGAIENVREICGTSFRWKGEAMQVRKREANEEKKTPATYYFVRRDANLEEIG